MLCYFPQVFGSHKIDNRHINLNWMHCTMKSNVFSHSCFENLNKSLPHFAMKYSKSYENNLSKNQIIFKPEKGIRHFDRKCKSNCRLRTN